jgi:hypothetical protein
MIGFQTAAQAQVVQSLSCNSSQLALYQSFQNIGAIPASHFVPRAHLFPKDERNDDFSFDDRRKFIQNRARSFNMWSGSQRRIRLAGAIPGGCRVCQSKVVRVVRSNLILFRAASFWIF